jgi:hypothetical protein
MLVTCTFQNNLDQVTVSGKFGVEGINAPSKQKASACHLGEDPLRPQVVALVPAGRHDKKAASTYISLIAAI